MSQPWSDLERRIAESVPRVEPALRDEALFQAGCAVGRRVAHRQLVAVSGAASLASSAISLLVAIWCGLVTPATSGSLVGRLSNEPDTVARAAAGVAADPDSVPQMGTGVLSAAGGQLTSIDSRRDAREDQAALPTSFRFELDRNVLITGRRPTNWDF